MFVDQGMSAGILGGGKGKSSPTKTFTSDGPS